MLLRRAEGIAARWSGPAVVFEMGLNSKTGTLWFVWADRFDDCQVFHALI
jgi:hypothetical protein